MIITVNDTTNSAKPLFYQSLTLLFLPCEKFTQNDSENKLNISACESDGNCLVNVELIVGSSIGRCEATEKIDSEKQSQMKNLIGRTFLEAAFKIFGTKPPWGISTGVKPVKLARMFYDESGRDKTFDILVNDYAVSERKATLCLDAAERERCIMDKLPKNACSVYISIPFCPSRCNYCSFVSCTTPHLLSLIPDYLVKLYEDIRDIAMTVNRCGLKVVSIYVGGGTPAILDERQIASLVDLIRSYFDDTSIEFTFEAGRPDCITRAKLDVLHDFGVGRISINTQTTNDEILSAVGRKHTFSQYLSSMEEARKVGFHCINTDLIAGLPGESAESFCRSVDDVKSQRPENITVHAFTLKKSSVYRVHGETDISKKDKAAEQMTDYAYERLSAEGYFPYYIYRQKNTVGNLDNAGYALDGFESIYNMVMMGEYHTVLAAGAGAVTKLVSENGHIERIFAPKYPYEYLDADKYHGFDKDSVCRFYNA